MERKRGVGGCELRRDNGKVNSLGARPEAVGAVHIDFQARHERAMDYPQLT